MAVLCQHGPSTDAGSMIQYCTRQGAGAQGHPHTMSLVSRAWADSRRRSRRTPSGPEDRLGPRASAAEAVARSTSTPLPCAPFPRRGPLQGAPHALAPGCPHPPAGPSPGGPAAAPAPSSHASAAGGRDSGTLPHPGRRRDMYGLPPAVRQACPGEGRRVPSLGHRAGHVFDCARARSEGGGVRLGPRGGEEALLPLPRSQSRTGPLLGKREDQRPTGCR